MICGLGVPDYKTRLEILQKKIKFEHWEKYHIPDEVLAYIASNIKNNIRELEGALNNTIALYKLDNTKDEIDIDLAKEALKELLSCE